MEPKRLSWGSFQAAGGESRPQRSSFKDYLWFIFGAAIVGVILFCLVFVGYQMSSWDRREQRREMSEYLTGEKIKAYGMDDLYGDLYIAGFIGAGVGATFGLWYTLKSMARERHEEELRKGRQQLAAGRFRTGFKVD